jgi:serine/threonine-protein kinase
MREEATERSEAYPPSDEEASALHARILRTPLRSGPYVPERLIGRGGMAMVHTAERLDEREPRALYAVKRILPELAHSSAFVNMFCEEARIATRLVHPNIVRALDFGEQDGELVLVLEYVDGPTVGELLRRLSKRGRCFPLAAGLFVAKEVLAALEYAHGLRGYGGEPLGIVHRDVSPANILVGIDGAVKLADFGVARSNDGPRDADPRGPKGKFGYMSPEQVASRGVDARTDLYSVGIVLFEMLTGRPLIVGRTDSELRARMHEPDLSVLADQGTTNLPFELRLVLGTALARDPGERYRSAREFSDALSAFARHARIDVTSTSLVSLLRTLGFGAPRRGTFSSLPAKKKPAAGPLAAERDRCDS